MRVRSLADNVVGSIESPYDKANAIENYLRGNYPYNLRVEPPPFDKDGVDHFLFTLKEGYSEYFGSSMSVLLRTVGVPARLAVGYTTGDRIGDQDVFAVTDSHSHAWVEVYFPGFGWIPFEPTPGEALPSVYQPGVEPLEVQQGREADIDSLDEECFDGLEDCSNPQETGSTLGFNFEQGDDKSIIGFWPWVVSMLAGLAAVGGTTLLSWRKFLAAPKDPRTAFRRLTTMANLASVGPSEFQTPYQFGNRLQQVLPAHKTPVSIIVGSYVRNRYGNRQTTASESRLLAVAWQRLRLRMLWTVFRRRIR